MGGASRTPLVHRLLRERLGRELHTEVDPDLCVAMGAAIQGGLIDGIDVGPVLVDITPHTLGIQAVGPLHGGISQYHFAPVIRRNTPLPASRTELFSTTFDGQEKVEIKVYQGENENVRFNQEVGGFMLEGLADAAQGNEILVRFDLDLDGILKVTALERVTGLQEQLTIDNPVSRFRQQNLQRPAACAAGHGRDPDGRPGGATARRTGRSHPEEPVAGGQGVGSCSQGHAGRRAGDSPVGERPVDGRGGPLLRPHTATQRRAGGLGVLPPGRVGEA